jgi:hypothetical protein
MPHLTYEYLGRKPSVALILEITVRSGWKIVGDCKGIVGGVEFAGVNLRKSAGGSFASSERGWKLSTCHRKNSEKGFASTSKGGCHEAMVPI